MRTFVDDDLALLGRAGAAAAMREFLRAAARGVTDSPPRITVPVAGRSLVITAGGSQELGVLGFRAYSRGGGAEPAAGVASQTVVLMDATTGALLAVACGDAFGAWRTAAFGAVAFEECAPAGRVVVAALGTGFQAGHHTRAWAATGRVSAFRVWGRRPAAAAALAAELVAETGVPASAAPSPEAALEGAAAVLCTTRSTTPLFGADAVPRAGYVATIGPKFGGKHELPAEAYARAAVLVTDAPAQVAAFETSLGPLPAGRRADECVALADVVAGRAKLPAQGLRLFVSEGLAGTEVALLDALRRCAPPR